MPIETPDMTVAELVKQNPARSRVFERFGIDYCCGGKKPLSLACRERGLDTAEVVGELEKLAAGPGGSGGDWSAAGLEDLASHIVQTHHAFLRRELPRLEQLLVKVVRAHGHAHPSLREVQSTFQRFAGEMREHMDKEERVLFPRIVAAERKGAEPGGPWLEAPISVMEAEHERAGADLARLRELTQNYQPPVDACPTYRALLEGLSAVERDTHEHVHKENNILFPRAAGRG